MRAGSTARWAPVAALLALFTAAYGAEPGPKAPPSVRAEEFGVRNGAQIHEFLATAAAPGAGLDDYYFALIGDIQNSVRSFRRDVMEAIAANLHESTDDGGLPLYDKVRFVILLGDIVYEGPNSLQWESLRKAFAGIGPEGASYPALARLVKEKPILPVLGNHEILSFRPRLQTRYKDLFDSAKGVRKFQEFFDWDRLIADPRILYSVPADLPEGLFREIGSKLRESRDRESLSTNYVRKKDGRYHLKFYENPPLREAEFSAGKERLAAELAPIFRKAGYGTLPVLNSDNMACYAFEAGNVVYLFLDSMARGWHYPGFARFKQALYPVKEDRHRLNLFSVSPFNGQADFCRAVAAYAGERGKTLVPMMHHSIFNSSRDIYSTGLEYNVWLALGLPQAPGEKGDPTIFDDILFSNVPCTFSACVHWYEEFSVVSKMPGRPDHALRWWVSGGGGGPLRSSFVFARNELVANLYNQKLSREDPAGAARSIEIRDDKRRVGHHYLIVHVKNGSIVEVSPRFIDPEALARSKPRPRLAVVSSYASRPGSIGAALELTLGERPVTAVHGYLQFMAWTPALRLGIVDYGAWGSGTGFQGAAAALEVSPLTFNLSLPRSVRLTLRLPGLEVWEGGANRRRFFLTMGADAPLLYDIFGRLENLSFGIKAYLPFRAGAASDPGFGGGTRIAFNISYKFRL